MSERITEAVILMAGAGSRFQRNGETRLKPLVPIAGQPLISYLLEALVGTGIKTIHAVIGFERDLLQRELSPLIPPELDAHWIVNPQWRLKNGVSLLAAAPHVQGTFLLTMADHLFAETVVDLLIAEQHPGWLNVAIDRKIDSIFDLEDAMKVRTRGKHVVAIGKELKTYNAIDTGVFVCPPSFFHYLEQAKQNGDCSLADGVQAMARDGLVRGIDIGAAWWQDVDTPEMLARAEEHLREARRREERARLTERVAAR
jgi:1L-myo-inositol 1-phosphate cytidylyltransferase